jgi:quinol-cytochrome oxidoreductase complex cytochrome b subunit
MTYYRPTVAEAFASVNYLMTDVNFGWLIRSIHRWSASMMYSDDFTRLSSLLNRWI